MIADDAGLIAAIREVFESVDPMPADLPERIQFTIALRDLDAELARFASESDEAAIAVRGMEESRTITFDSDSLTIMIRIDGNADGTVRVDGWLAPAQAGRVEMRRVGNSIAVTADEAGRFAFLSVPRGTARLIVALLGEGNHGRPNGEKSVITPALILLAAE